MWLVSNRRGFTLVELMISVAIITILSVILFVNFANQNRKAAVRQAANQIALDLQKMYAQAQAGQELSGVTQLGYGISLQTGQSSFQLYHDTAAQPDGIYTDGSEDIFRRQLPTNVTISNIQEKPVFGSPTNRSRVDLLYGIPGAGLSVKVGTVPPLSATINRIIITVQYTTIPSLTQCVAVTPNVGAVNLSCT